MAQVRVPWAWFQWSRLMVALALLSPTCLLAEPVYHGFSQGMWWGSHPTSPVVLSGFTFVCWARHIQITQEALPNHPPLPPSLLPSSHIKMARKEMKVCAFQNAPKWFWCSVLAESLGVGYPSRLQYCRFSFLLLLLPGFPVCLNFIENAHSSTLYILAPGLNISLPQVLGVLVGLPSLFLLAMWVRDGAERETGGRTLGGTRSIIGFQIIKGLWEGHP